MNKHKVIEKFWKKELKIIRNRKKNKIPKANPADMDIEDLFIQADEWWNNIPINDIFRNKKIIINAYMKANNIKRENIKRRSND